MSEEKRTTSKRVPFPKRWFIHRSVQSYVALAAMLLIALGTMLGWVTDEAGEVVGSITWALASVVLVYHGGNAAIDCATKLAEAQRSDGGTDYAR